MKVYIVFKKVYGLESIWTVCKDSKDAAEWEDHLRSLGMEARTEIYDLM